MKLFQKVYLITLILFLFIFDLCTILLVNSVYKKNLEMSKNHALQTYYMMETNFWDDLNAMANRNSINLNTITSLVETYANNSQKNNIYCGLLNEDKLIYNNFPQDNMLENIDLKKSNYICELKHFDKECYIIIAHTNIIKNQEYNFVLIERLLPLEQLLSLLTTQAFIFCILATLMLSVPLYFILSKVMAPLNKLTNASLQITNGIYNNDINVKGDDELAILAKQFTIMSAEINNKIETLESEMQKKQLFIDNLSHEMKTPLTAIQGYSEYLLLTNPDESTKQNSLAYILKESKRLAQLSNTLLLMTNMREGEFSKEIIYLEEMTKSIKDELKFLLEEKKIELAFNNQFRIISLNEILLHSLFRNLIENAIRACEQDGKIEVSILRNGGQVTIIIKDNGVGMDEKELCHITEPFYRVDKSRSRIGGGSGLGLSLCNYIVQFYRGNITFESTKKEGTKVIIKFYNIFTS